MGGNNTKYQTQFWYALALAATVAAIPGKAQNRPSSAGRMDTMGPGAIMEDRISQAEAADADALAHFNRGRLLFDQGRNAEALPELEAASSIAPLVPEPYYFRGVIEEQAGHYKQAGGLFQTVVRLQPRNATAWYLLGQSLEYRSQTKAAIAAWNKAVAIDPDYTEALWSLARAIKPSDPGEAARLTARYSELQQNRRIVDEAGTLGDGALAAAASHDWPEAIRQFRRAVELCGDCAIKAVLHKRFGLTYCQMGDLDGGEKELRLAQSLKPSDPDIKRALARIAAARAKLAKSHPDPEKAR